MSEKPHKVSPIAKIEKLFSSRCGHSKGYTLSQYFLVCTYSTVYSTLLMLKSDLSFQSTGKKHHCVTLLWVYYSALVGVRCQLVEKKLHYLDRVWLQHMDRWIWLNIIRAVLEAVKWRSRATMMRKGILRVVWSPGNFKFQTVKL